MSADITATVGHWLLPICCIKYCFHPTGPSHEISVLLAYDAVSLGHWCAPFRDKLVALSSLVQRPIKIIYHHPHIVDRHSSVIIVTSYGLAGSGIESRWERDFPHPPSLLYDKYRVFSPLGKRPGRGINHPPTSSAEVKERIELHFYSPCEPSWPAPTVYTGTHSLTKHVW